MLAIIQARFSSVRLPGKMLRPLAGRPMLGWVVERLRAAERVAQVVVATSRDPSDDAIADYCAQSVIECFRGDLNDVAGRMAAAAEWAEADAFVRVSGDSPLMLPAVIDEMIALFACVRPDLATNVQLRTFPKGLSVEAVEVRSLRLTRDMMQPGEEEHVTGAFYRNPDRFRIVNLTSGRDWGRVQLSVDTAADFAIAEQMLLDLPDAGLHASVADLVALREHCVAKATA